MNQSMNQRDMFFKWLYYAGAVLLLVLVQSLVLNRISVWAVHPFLPPVIAGIMAMLEGPAEGAVFGGIFGLLCDLTMPGVIPCFYTLAFVADGAGAGRDGGAVAAGVSAAAQRAQPDPEIGGVP